MTGPERSELPIDRYHEVLAAIIKGDPDPQAGLWSHADDVVLGNPFGPFAQGWERVAATLKAAAANMRDGEVVGFEHLTTYLGGDLAYLVEVERTRVKLGGADELSPVSLRVSSVFRLEDGAWKLVLRHADPITSPRPPESAIER